MKGEQRIAELLADELFGSELITELVRLELMQAYSYYDDCEDKKTKKAIARVIKYYSTESQYHRFKAAYSSHESSSD